MKTRFSYLLMIIAFWVLTTSQTKGDLLAFEQTAFDFGVIADNSSPVVHEYKFVNIHTEPVAVLSVSTECGCARPEYPVRPLAPGDSATIKITYTPHGESGEIIKDIKVRYRAAKGSRSKRTVLRLTGIVKPQ